MFLNQVSNLFDSERYLLRLEGLKSHDSRKERYDICRFNDKFNNDA